MRKLQRIGSRTGTRTRTRVRVPTCVRERNSNRREQNVEWEKKNIWNSHSKHRQSNSNSNSNSSGFDFGWLWLIDRLGSEEMLLFASDYPHWHDDTLEPVLSEILAAGFAKKILYDNAAAVYRF